MKSRLRMLGLGALLAYLYDPDSGPRRRRRLRRSVEDLRRRAAGAVSDLRPQPARVRWRKAGWALGAGAGVVAGALAIRHRKELGRALGKVDLARLGERLGGPVAMGARELLRRVA